MALTTISGPKLVIKFGDGETDETFTSTALINTDRGIKFSCDVNESAIPDPDNPDDPAWNDLFKKAISVEISGKGYLDAVATTMATWTTWAGSQDSKNIQIWLDSSIGYWSGAFKLTEFDLDGTWGEDVTCNMTLKSHGKVTWTTYTASSAS